MSKVDEIREVLRANRNIIVTEQTTTVVPFQTSDNGTGHSWTQAVHFSLIPKYTQGRDSNLWHFQKGIVASMPVTLANEGPIKGWSYGKAHCREAIGTMIKRSSRLITIDDRAIPLTDDFTGRVWERTKEPVVTELYRLITLGFYPPEHLYMMVSGVANQNRNEVWLHEPTERHLEEMHARMQRNRR